MEITERNIFYIMWAGVALLMVTMLRLCRDSLQVKWDML